MQGRTLDMKHVDPDVLGKGLDARVGEPDPDVEGHQVAHALRVTGSILTGTARRVCCR
ncbi:hypothetical protein IDVR_02110 [Intrasporangium sp. DVR]